MAGLILTGVACAPPVKGRIVTVKDGDPVPNLVHGDTLFIDFGKGTVDQFLPRCDWMGGELTESPTGDFVCEGVDF